MITDCGFAFQPVKHKSKLRSFGKIQEKFRALKEPEPSLKPVTTPIENSIHTSIIQNDINTDTSHTIKDSAKAATNTQLPVAKSPNTRAAFGASASLNLTLEYQTTKEAEQTKPHQVFFLEKLDVLDSERFKKAQLAIAQREFFVPIKNEENIPVSDNLSKLVCKPNEKRKSITNTELKIIKKLRSINRKKNQTINPYQMASSNLSKHSEVIPRRRSTFGVRGKRASGIGNGYSASPHEAIETKILYRHISPETPEPLRLRQLLSWCVQRNYKPNIPPELEYNRSILNLAEKALKEVINELKAAIEGGVLTTSWYNRPKTQSEIENENKSTNKISTTEPEESQTLHPQNIANEKRKAELIEQIVTLQEENRKFSKIQKQTSITTSALESLVPEDVAASLKEFLEGNQILLGAKKGLQDQVIESLPALSMKNRPEIQNWDADIAKYKPAYEFELPSYYKTLYGHDSNVQLASMLSLKTQTLVDNIASKANTIQSKLFSSSDLAEYSKAIISKASSSRSLNNLTSTSDSRPLLLELSKSLGNVSLTDRKL